MLRFRAALMIFALLASCSAPERIVQEANSLDEAQALAVESGGLIVLEFWSDG